MKRLLVAFFMILIVVPSYAENWIRFKSEVVEKAINQLVASERRQAAADEYQKNMDQTNGKISVTGIYKVCIASGFNIQTNDGYNLCRNFLNFMMSESKFGTGSATQQNCANKFNGIWTLSADGNKYQCVGRDGYELVYKRSCSGAGGECIKQFADLQTQGSNGREFINAYGKLHGLNLTCHSVTETRRSVANPLGQDYIKCSAGGRAYEFEFDDLNQTPGDKSSHSENTAICELYGGKIVDTGDKNTESIWQSCDISSELCNGAVADLAMRTGHTVQYQGYCRLSRKAKVVSVVDLHQIDGIDSRIFYNAGAQMRMDTAKPMVEEYLRTQFPNETYIVCDTNPRELNRGLGVDIDYVMSCTVGAQRVDFVFDDLSESFDSDAATGMDIMQCIINGGTFKGESCRGPTKEECEKLDAVLRSKGSDKGARYDDEARACILGNAEATYKRDVRVGYVTGAVVIVGGALVTIGTGGAAGPVVVNGVAMLAGDIAINYAIDANHQRLTNKAAKKFVNFVTDADACTTEQCALDVLEKHYATLSGVMIDLNTDDQAVVDETMDKLIGLIKTEFVACGKDDSGKTIYASPADCAMQQSHLKLMDYIDPVSEPVLIIGSIAYNPGYVTNKFMKLKKVSKLAKFNDTTDAAVVAGSKIKNPKQWKPGEDVAEYMDVEKLQSKFDDIDKRHAAYLDELKQRKENLEQLKYSTPAQTDEQKALANVAFDEYEKRLTQLVEKNMDESAEYNKVKDEISSYRTQIKNEHRAELDKLETNGDYVAYISKFEEYETDLSKSSPEFAALLKREEELGAKYEKTKEIIESSSDDVDLLRLKQEYQTASNAKSPAYEAVLNEQAFVDELILDTERTIGDEKNVALWDAIPNEIKQKLPEIRDNEIVEILAKDDMLTHYVNNFDEVSKNTELYDDFLSRIAHGFNGKHNMSTPVSISTYNNPHAPLTGGQAVGSNIQFNSARSNYVDLDGTIGVVKHEVGHVIDKYAPNDGIIGETLQAMDTWTSHGNYDEHFTVAISPSGLNSFSVGGITPEQTKLLETEGWKIMETTDIDTYTKYRAKPTEKSSWSITPTSNIKQKVNSYREANGVTK